MPDEIGVYSELGNSKSEHCRPICDRSTQSPLTDPYTYPLSQSPTLSSFLPVSLGSFSFSPYLASACFWGLACAIPTGPVGKWMRDRGISVEAERKIKDVWISPASAELYHRDWEGGMLPTSVSLAEVCWPRVGRPVGHLNETHQVLPLPVYFLPSISAPVRRETQALSSEWYLCTSAFSFVLFNTLQLFKEMSTAKVQTEDL